MMKKNKKDFLFFIFCLSSTALKTWPYKTSKQFPVYNSTACKRIYLSFRYYHLGSFIIGPHTPKIRHCVQKISFHFTVSGWQTSKPSRQDPAILPESSLIAAQWQNPAEELVARLGIDKADSRRGNGATYLYKEHGNSGCTVEAALFLLLLRKLTDKLHIQDHPLLFSRTWSWTRQLSSVY